MEKNFIIKVGRIGQSCKKITPQNGKFFTLKEQQEMVGGFVEYLPIGSTQTMVVNDMGMINGMQVNEEATALYSKFIGELKFIYGNVAVIQNELLDGNED